MPVKSVVFPLEEQLPIQARYLLGDFRLAVNRAIREGIHAGVTSKFGLTKLLYKDFRNNDLKMYSQHLVSAFEVAGSILKNYRRRVRRGEVPRIPYARKLFMKAENQAFRLDRDNGIIDLPLTAGHHITLKLVISNYHRRYLDDLSYSLGSLTLHLDRVILTFKKDAPKKYAVETALSLDTNEQSLDGIFVTDNSVKIVKIEFHEISQIQNTHFLRRRRLQKKKAHDRRTLKNLCRREGVREHNRIEYRLNQIANSILACAEKHKSVIILEDLNGIKPRMNKELNRRISIWPRRKLHFMIEYKADWRGIPVFKVDPRNSSRKCPICGKINKSRKSTTFTCKCGWKFDKHINASINLLQTAISKEMVGGLRFSPGAFQHDVMMTLYCKEKTVRSEPNGTSCIG